MTKKGSSEPKRLSLNKTIVFNEQKSKNKNSMFSLGEAFSCSLDSMLRQSEKASFRNYFKNESNSNTSKCPQGVSWFIDDLALVWSLKPKKNYREWIQCLVTQSQNKVKVFRNDKQHVKA